MYFVNYYFLFWCTIKSYYLTILVINITFSYPSPHSRLSQYGILSLEELLQIHPHHLQQGKVSCNLVEHLCVKKWIIWYNKNNIVISYVNKHKNHFLFIKFTLTLYIVLHGKIVKTNNTSILRSVCITAKITFLDRCLMPLQLSMSYVTLLRK